MDAALRLAGDEYRYEMSSGQYSRGLASTFGYRLSTNFWTVVLNYTQKKSPGSQAERGPGGTRLRQSTCRRPLAARRGSRVPFMLAAPGASWGTQWEAASKAH